MSRKIQEKMKILGNSRTLKSGGTFAAQLLRIKMREIGIWLSSMPKTLWFNGSAKANTNLKLRNGFE